MNSHETMFNPNDRTLRQFSGMWIVFLGAVAARQAWHQHYLRAAVLAVLAFVVGPMGLIRPTAIRFIFVGWMRLVYPIGWTVSRSTLGILFYGLFTPIALVFRVIGRDALGLKQQSHADTYWRSKPQPVDKAQYMRQF
jgi:hypothetical protein